MEEQIIKSLSGKMLHTAFAAMKMLVGELISAHSVLASSFSDRLQSLQQNYQLLVDYYLAGQNDPHRDDVLSSIVRESFVLLDDILLERYVQTSSSYEVVLMKRVEEQLFMLPTNNEQFAKEQSQASDLKSTTDAEAVGRVFDSFWLRKRLENWELDVLASYVNNPQMQDEALMGISGLTLNLLRSFSERNILYLMRFCHDDVAGCLRERAWVGLLLVLMKYDSRLSYFQQIISQLQDLLDTDEGQVYARTVLTCLIRTEGVDLASATYKSVQDKLMPLISKNLPNIDDASRVITTDEIEDFGLQIDEEMSSFLEEQRRSIDKMKGECLDTNYAMFSGMYSTSFFSEPYRWWLPYSSEYLWTEEQKQAAKFVDTLPFDDVCDSDYYAFVSVIASTGVKNGENLSLNPDNMQLPTGKMLCNGYVQQAYRFFRLNPWGVDKANFNLLKTKELRQNPFSLVASLPSTQLFRLLNPTAAEKKISADHFLHCHAYRPAINIYEQLQASITSLELHCNHGWALQKEQRYEEAIVQYSQALSIEKTEWALRQKAFCLTHLSRYDEALETLDTLLLISPQNTAYIFEKAQCLEHLELFVEALEYYYKLALRLPENAKVMRAIAWCSFLCDQYADAEKYYAKLMETGKQKMVDYLNYGHLLFVLDKRMDAFANYSQALHLCESLKAFLSVFRPDRKILLEKKVAKPTIYLMEDLLIQVSSQG